MREFEYIKILLYILIIISMCWKQNQKKDDNSCFWCYIVMLIELYKENKTDWTVCEEHKTHECE